MLNCGLDDLSNLIYPQQLEDINRLEQIISHRLLGDKRKKQQDRMSSNRLSDSHIYDSRICRRRDGRNDSTRPSNIPRDNRRDGHRFDHRERHKESPLVSRDLQHRHEGRTGRYEHDSNLRVTLASATTDDFRAAVEELRLRQHADQYESQDEQSDYDYSNNYE